MAEEIIESPEKNTEPAEEFFATGKITRISTILTPEGFIMMAVAIILDSVGLILFILSFLGVGIPGSFIPDLIGLIIIGIWTYLRSGRTTMTKQATELAKKSFKRVGLAFLGEVIPFFGDAAPCWTIAVYRELTKGV